MASRKITNPVPQVTSMAVKTDALLTHTITQAKATHTAGVALCFSGAAFILSVSHFLDTKSDGYMTRSDAVDYLKEEIRKQTGVKNRMLDQYVNVATKIAGFLMGSSKMFTPTLQQVGLAKTPEDVVNVLVTWWENAKNKKIENMQELNESLGYAAQKERNAGGGNAVTAENAGERVSNLLETIHENVVGTGKGKLPEKMLAAPIMEKIVSKGDFLVEAIKNTFDESALAACERAIKDQYKTIKRLSDEASSKVVKLDTKRAKGAAAAKAKRKHPATRRATA
jgi:hypothetical protein